MAKPPTLGDSLSECMAGRGHSADVAAAALGATPVEVEHWAVDLGTPRDAQFTGIADYLDVDTDEVKRLVLRSQMRQVQSDIRGDTAPSRAAS